MRVHNIRELVINEHSFEDSLLNDVFVCFLFDDGMKLIYKDIDGMYGHGNKLYSRKNR